MTRKIVSQKTFLERVEWNVSENFVNLFEVPLKGEYFSYASCTEIRLQVLEER
jgi:hypothetical protein